MFICPHSKHSKEPNMKHFQHWKNTLHNFAARIYDIFQSFFSTEVSLLNNSKPNAGERVCCPQTWFLPSTRCDGAQRRREHTKQTEEGVRPIFTRQETGTCISLVGETQHCESNAFTERACPFWYSQGSIGNWYIFFSSLSLVHKSMSQF